MLSFCGFGSQFKGSANIESDIDGYLMVDQDFVPKGRDFKFYEDELRKKIYRSFGIFWRKANRCSL